MNANLDEFLGPFTFKDSKGFVGVEHKTPNGEPTKTAAMFFNEKLRNAFLDHWISMMGALPAPRLDLHTEMPLQALTSPPVEKHPAVCSKCNTLNKYLEVAGSWICTPCRS